LDCENKKPLQPSIPFDAKTKYWGSFNMKCFFSRLLSQTLARFCARFSHVL